MSTMKGKGAAVKGTSYQNKFEQPPVYTMPVTKRIEMPAKNAPRYAKGGDVGMRSGLRGGKPRDMATMSHGGKTSRGAGAAQRGYNYDVYRKGGTVKKYAEGGSTRPEYGMSRGTESMPSWDVPQYSFSDLFGKKKKAQETKPTAVEKPALETPKSDDRGETYGGVPVFQGVEPEPLPAPRPTPRQRARAAARPRPRGASEEQMRGMTPNYGESMARGVNRPLTNAEIVRRRNQPSSGDFSIVPAYAKGGKVKMASGGSCRGMGAATKGGKYTIK